LDKSEKSTQEILKPPYGGKTPFANFFAKLQKRRMEKVDGPFLVELEIASKGNEPKVINGLKFLGLIREDGSATEKMETLNVEGEPFRKALETIIRDAYSKLFKNIKNIETADAVDFRNCFKVDYSMAPQLAAEATRIFIYLAKSSGIQLSQNLMSEEQLTHTDGKGAKKKAEIMSNTNRGALQNIPNLPENANGEYVFVPKGMQRWEAQGKVLLFLPKISDKTVRAQASKFAKQLIAMYEADESSNG